MQKDEILRKSRQENVNGDEREKQFRKHSMIAAVIAGLVVGFGLMVMEALMVESGLVVPAVTAISSAMASAQHWYLLFTTKKKYECFVACCFLISTVVMILMFYNRLMSL